MRKIIFGVMWALMSVMIFAAPEVTDVVAKQQYPWNGKVDITYSVSGNLKAGLPEWMSLVVSVSALDRTTGSNYLAKVSALSGDLGTEEGAHHIVWDFNAQDLQVKSDDMVFTVAYLYYSRYCVIDLSSGVNATSYPVSYLEDVPEGGWTDEYKTTKLVLRLIEPGSFKMNGLYDVTLTKPYYMGVFEVTQKQFELVIGSNPSSYKGDARPVEYLTWNAIRGNSDIYDWPNVKTVDPNSFVGLIRSKTGLSLDLPTEAQWEYACRAGTTSSYNNGGNTEADLKTLGRYSGNQNDGRGGYSQHTTVGLYAPNAWGLYDMHGNIQEWCLDWHGNLFVNTDPLGSVSGSRRVMRGGSWEDADVNGVTSSHRITGLHSYGDESDGFRLVRTLSNIDSELMVEAASSAERVGTILCLNSGESTKVDSRKEPLVNSIDISYNSAWIGGDPSAEVVISADGTEIKRATGEGEFVWVPTMPGKHTLTYTTYIDGVRQDDVYTIIVFKDWKYTLDDNKATIVETTQTSGDVIIPSEIDGYPVVAIGDGLFKGCEGLTGVVIPDSVTSVGAGAFNGCSRIKSASISPTCKIGSFKIGLYQVKFNSRDDFTSSILSSESKSLVSGVLMGDVNDNEPIARAYSDPKYGGHYQWNASNTTFGYAGYMYMVEGRTYVFGKYFDDSVLVRINGTEVLKNTDYTSFATGSYKVERTGWYEIEVRLGDKDGAKGPEGNWRSGCWSGALGVAWRDDGITNALPESSWNKMMDPGDGSLFRCTEGFKDLAMSDLFPDSCTQLTNLTLTGGMTEVSDRFLAGCAALESFTIPNGVTTICANAFEDCSSLTEIVIPDSVYSIGANAFANCSSLTKVLMPLSLKSQVEAGDLFVGCSKDLEIVYHDAEIKNVVAKQRFPWNGKVDITYNVTRNIAAGLPDWKKPVISVSALDRTTGSNYLAQASSLSGDLGTEEGTHHIVWDFNAQDLQVKSDDMVFTVAYDIPLYCIIDLSPGVNATSYPVSYLYGIPEEGWTDEYKTTKLVLRLIEPGSFKMNGSCDVTLTKPYYMGVFEVTQTQYELITGNNPSDFVGDKKPVDSVSWNMIRGDSYTYNWPTVETVDSNSFIGRLQARTGLSFDLPTEAQWEYACRAGTTTTYSYGDSADSKYMWYNLKGTTSYEVGTKLHNAWGLYDMHGNALEWCLDWYGNLSSGMNPKGGLSGEERVRRGGAWGHTAASCTSSSRYGTVPSNEGNYLGLRLSRVLLNTREDRVASAERAGEILFFASGESVAINSYFEPLADSIDISYNSAWIGDDSSAEAVISADGTEIKRATGEGEFAWAPTTTGKHTLTYTTYIDGVQQEEVYTATVFKDWKYTVDNGGARIIETTQTSGDVRIPSEIDGYPVVGLDGELFNDCEDLTTVTIPMSLKSQVEAGSVFAGCSEDLEIVYRATELEDFSTSITKWGYFVSGLGSLGNEIAIVFTNNTEKSMSWTLPKSIENIQFLVVGGGGGGGADNFVEDACQGGAGGGGGGVITGTIAKLEKESKITITVGGGGAGGIASKTNSGKYGAGTKGGNSIININNTDIIVANGGGCDMGANSAYGYTNGNVGGSGGSGGGGRPNKLGGVANPGTVVENYLLSYQKYGNNGGNGCTVVYDKFGYGAAGGGGGAIAPGGNGTKGDVYKGGNGGEGLSSDITGIMTVYGSGGGGSSTWGEAGDGGTGAGDGVYGGNGKPGLANQGGGGGGSSRTFNGGNGGSGIVVLRFVITNDSSLDEVFPEVLDDSEVAAALVGSADAKLAENITSAAEYAAYREWALGFSGATAGEIKASPYSWLSYALDVNELIATAIKYGDVVIDTVETAATDGAFGFTVKIDGIDVGEGALEANIRKVFDIEGAKDLIDGTFSAETVEINAAEPENGKIRFTVTPKGETPANFFFKVKMK